MSLKRNILANYVSQIYVTLIGIVMVPTYIRYMGAEAYGLVGFFAMLQAWFQLLDMGLTPTMARETARFRGGAADGLTLRRLMRTLEGIFVAVALLGVAAMMLQADDIAGRWLKVQQLSLDEVRDALMLMGAIAALRWVGGLYRGAVNGFERMVWLSGLNVAVATVRFVLVVPFFVYVGSSPRQFFSYQLAVAVVELVLLVAKTYRLLPKVEAGQRVPWQWEPLRGVLKFSLSIAFTSAVWVLLTQTDKLVLSKLLPLADYAYFTLAVLLAGGVMLISGPISGALLPRMTKLSAEGDEAGLVRVYRNATQLVGVIAAPVALVLAFFPEQVLWAWTGDADIARKAAPVLALYAIGNWILALAAFPYYLQYAKGDLRLHLIGNALFVAIFVPTLLWATSTYGMVGAGYAWLITNLMPFIFWLPIVHRRFAQGLHLQWLLRDVGSIALIPAAVAFSLHELLTWPTARLPVTIEVIVVGMALFAVVAASSRWVRGMIRDWWLMQFVRKGV